MARYLLVLCLLLVACSNEPIAETTTSPSVSPPDEAGQALEAILGDVAAGDGTAVVDERQIVLLAGAEGATTSEIADLFSAVGSGRVAVNFWRGFSEGLIVDGVDLSDVRFGRVDEFTAGGIERSSIEVWDAPREQVRVWHLGRVEGEWRLDLFATFGDVYAGPLRLLIRSLDPAADGYVEVATALTDQRSSLDLAPATQARLDLSSELASLP